MAEGARLEIVCLLRSGSWVRIPPSPSPHLFCKMWDDDRDEPKDDSDK